jgi:hypothetical protein
MLPISNAVDKLLRVGRFRASGGGDVRPKIYAVIAAARETVMRAETNHAGFAAATASSHATKPS